MPEKQERRSSKRPMSRAVPPNKDGAPAPRSRRRTSNGRNAGVDEPVDFRVAAQRMTARAALIGRLKTEVERGTYPADADETARAMERRSDA